MTEREAVFMKNGGYGLLCSMDTITPRSRSTIIRQHGLELFKMAVNAVLIRESPHNTDSFVLTTRGQELRNR